VYSLKCSICFCATQVPTQLVGFPGEGHGIDTPCNQRVRDQRTLEWFLRYLPVKQA
jgi:dipeptidyl aminopeptidase/acylaminoacyl peptidase